MEECTQCNEVMDDLNGAYICMKCLTVVRPCHNHLDDNMIAWGGLLDTLNVKKYEPLKWFGEYEEIKKEVLETFDFEETKEDWFLAEPPYKLFEPHNIIDDNDFWVFVCEKCKEIYVVSVD